MQITPVNVRGVCYGLATNNERNPMAIFEFSDGFDAQGWYTEQMLKGSRFESDEDPYGWDEPAEYPY
jgi:hypothetical protein